MSKIFILLLAVFTVVPVTSAQEPSNFFSSSAENLACEDILPNKSVRAPFFNTSTLDLYNVERNSSLNLPIRVSNSNFFPIQNITVHLRLFKVSDSEGQAISPQLYATKVVSQNITLEAGESRELNHPFTVPTTLTNGVYRLSTYVESNQRFSLSGTNAYEIDPTAYLEFTLTEGQPYGPMIDRTAVQVNNAEYTFSSDTVSATTSSIVTNGVEATQISVVIKNGSDSEPTIGKFLWEEFSGDQPNPLTSAGSQTEPIKLIPGTQTVVSYQLLNPLPLDYTVVGTLSTKNNDEQSVIISFSEGDTASERGIIMTEPAITDPIDFATFSKSVGNENSTDLLFCYTPKNLLQYENPELSFSVIGPTGAVGEYSVDLSDITYSSVSQTDRFSFPSAPGAYTVAVNLSDSETVVSTSTLQYVRESSKTQITTDDDDRTTFLIAGMLLLGILISGLLFYRRTFTKLEN